jgi:multidrug efflux pump
MIRSFVRAGLVVLAFLPCTPRAETVLNDFLFTIKTTLPGAPLETITRDVARPLEGELGRLAGIEAVISISRAAKSTVTLKFRSARGPDALLAEVRDRLARSRLPPGADIRVSVPEPSGVPIAYLSVSSDTHPILNVSEIAERFILQPLATVADITELRSHGLRKSMVAIRLDTARVAAYGLSRDDVVAALRGAGLATETIGPDDIAVAAAAGALPPDMEALSNLVLRASAGAVIRLRDVAQIELSVRPSDVDVRFNGKPAVVAEIFVAARLALPDATRHVRDALPRLLAALPAGVDVTIVYACTRCAESPRR